MTEWWSKVRSLFFGRRGLADDLNEEIDAHLQYEIEDKLAAGMNPQTAREAARRGFGNATAIRERAWETWSFERFETLLSDLRYAGRTLAKSPSYTLVAILSLALGIGANTTVFSIMNSVLLMRFPYRNADRLVVIENTDAAGRPGGVAPANFRDWQRQTRSFEQIAAKVDWTAYNLTGPEGAEQVTGAPISAGMFEALGLQPELGRTFVPEDDRPEAEPTVILSDQVWTRRYIRNLNILGRRILVSGVSRTVVGVMPAGVYLNRDENTASGRVDEMWVPLRSQLTTEVMNWRDSSNLRVFALLKPGVSRDQAAAEMQLIHANLQKSYPKENAKIGVLVRPLSEFRADRIQTPRQITMILFAAVGLVLLIACANVASLQLVRAAVRRREIAIRVTLGAGRFRILRQLLTESLLLGLAGGGLGLGIAVWSMRLIKALVPDNVPLPRLDKLTVDHRVLTYTILISSLTGILTGVIPAMWGAAGDTSDGLNSALRASGRSVASDRRSGRLRRYLVGSQVAVALVLLLGAGLLIRSFLAIRATDPGFQPDHILTIHMPAPDVSSAVLASKEYRARRDRFMTAVLSDVGRLPGVVSVGMANGLPTSGELYQGSFQIEGVPSPGRAISRVVSADYFRTMGIPLRAGSVFGQADTETAPLVAVIDAELAERYFRNENPLGRRIRWQSSADSTPLATIVGVVAKVRDDDLGANPQPEIYFPYLQTGSTSLRTTLVIRAAGEAAGLAAAVRKAVHDLDPDQPIASVRTMQKVLDRSMAPERFNATLLSSFAVIALLLAAAGIYGVVSYSVTQRTHEIGVRMALGATAGRVLRAVLRKELAAVMGGFLIGGVCALSVERVLGSMLHGVSPADPVTIASVGFVLIVVVLLASCVPARRAMKVDPMLALRHE